jgi:arylsulfatase A-like enzyme
MDTGVKFKTVAQSTLSHPTFSTLSTGLYPFQHGVHGWTDKIPADIETVFDVETQEPATSSAAARHRTQCTRFLKSKRRPRYRT